MNNDIDLTRETLHLRCGHKHFVRGGRILGGHGYLSSASWMGAGTLVARLGGTPMSQLDVITGPDSTPVYRVRKIGPSDLKDALAKGLADFSAKPAQCFRSDGFRGIRLSCEGVGTESTSASPFSRALEPRNHPTTHSAASSKRHDFASDLCQ